MVHPVQYNLLEKYVTNSKSKIDCQHNKNRVPFHIALHLSISLSVNTFNFFLLICLLFELSSHVFKHEDEIRHLKFHMNFSGVKKVHTEKGLIPAITSMLLFHQKKLTFCLTSYTPSFSFPLFERLQFTLFPYFWLILSIISQLIGNK